MLVLKSSVKWTWNGLQPHCHDTCTIVGGWHVPSHGVKHGPVATPQGRLESKLLVAKSLHNVFDKDTFRCYVIPFFWIEKTFPTYGIVNVSFLGCPFCPPPPPFLLLTKHPTYKRLHAFISSSKKHAMWTIPRTNLLHLYRRRDFPPQFESRYQNVDLLNKPLQIAQLLRNDLKR